MYAFHRSVEVHFPKQLLVAKGLGCLFDHQKGSDTFMLIKFSCIFLANVSSLIHSQFSFLIFASFCLDIWKSIGWLTGHALLRFLLSLHHKKRFVVVKIEKKNVKMNNSSKNKNSDLRKIRSSPKNCTNRQKFKLMNKYYFIFLFLLPF